MYGSISTFWQSRTPYSLIVHWFSRVNHGLLVCHFRYNQKDMPVYENNISKFSEFKPCHKHKLQYHSIITSIFHAWKCVVTWHGEDKACDVFACTTFPVVWNRQILCYTTLAMDTSSIMARVEQPCVWTFDAIHTREHMYNYQWWLLLFYVCLSGTNSSMNMLHFYRFLWSTGPSITW